MRYEPEGVVSFKEHEHFGEGVLGWTGEDSLTLLHLADELLVEKTLGLLVERAVDGNDITLGQQLLEGIDAAAANLLLDLGRQGLVVVVEKLLAVEGLETAQHTLTNAANGDGADNLALEVVLLLGGSSNIPLSALNLLVGRDEVTDEDEDGHDNVLGDRDDIAAGDLSNSDAAIGLVGSIEIDVVGANTGGDGELEVLSLGETLGSQISRVETRAFVSSLLSVSSRARSDPFIRDGYNLFPSQSYLDDNGRQRPARHEVIRGPHYTYGVVMMTSASTSSWSNLEFSPSLSEVVTSV